MEGVWAVLTHSLNQLLREHPLLVVGVVLFFEELGVPSPLPGDVLMIAAGIGVRQGHYSLPVILLVEELVTIAGTTGLFVLSRRFGRRLVERYGRFIHLGPTSLARAEEAIHRSGWRAIVIGRLIPGLRIATPIAAAILNVPFSVFLPAVSVGAFLYLGFYTLLGVLIGPAALTFLERLALPTGALVSLGLLVVFLYVVRALKRELPAAGRGGRWLANAPLVDGLLAGVVALLATDGIVGLVIFVGRLLGNRLPVFATEAGTTLRLFLGWPLFLVLASLLGLLYDRLGVEHLSRRWRIAVISSGPLVLVAIVIILVTEWFAVGQRERRLVPLFAVEAVRWFAYAVALSELLVLDTALHHGIASSTAGGHRETA